MVDLTSSGEPDMDSQREAKAGDVEIGASLLVKPGEQVAPSAIPREGFPPPPSPSPSEAPFSTAHHAQRSSLQLAGRVSCRLVAMTHASCRSWYMRCDAAGHSC